MMLERKYVSQCVSSDYCKGWNDAVDSIVRCKDCKYAVLLRKSPQNEVVADCAIKVFYSGDDWYAVVRGEDFCSQGERRNDES